MPPLEGSPRRRAEGVEYSYRRRLGLRELWPAIGIGIGAGFLTYYIATVLLQRTPLKLERSRARDVERSSRS